MKKLLVVCLSVFLLAACGEETVEKKEVTTVESSEKTTNETTSEKKQEEKDIKELNQTIVDNETIKATLISVEKIVNEEWDEEKIEVKFEVENKREGTITVQSREVSADGKMIDESMLVMSQDISPGKKADAILTIQNYEGELPSIQENFEMILNVASTDTFEDLEKHNVKVNFK